MFRASLCPSSGEQEQDWLKLHVKMPDCAGCGCVEPWCRQCALFESFFSIYFNVCAAVLTFIDHTHQVYLTSENLIARATNNKTQNHKRRNSMP
jgi:hypothetical protein